MKLRTIIVLSCSMLIASIAAVMIFMHLRPIKRGFTIEWLEITPQTQASMTPLFNQLETIFIQAMLPVGKPIFYATDPRVAAIPAEKRAEAETKIAAGMVAGLHTEWQKKISTIYKA